MKRHGHLLERIADMENLEWALIRASKGKRHMPDAREYLSNHTVRLAELKEELQSGEIAVGEAHQFTIFDPKERVITAPSFRERVLHHAVMNVCEPLFDRMLIEHSFACRRGRGRVAAVAHAAECARRYQLFLKLDIRKCFDSIPHAKLLELLERRFKDPRLLDLWRRIIGSYATSPGRGLPIGSLTSQHFANFYLGHLDHFVKHELRVRGYARYMDDFALWGDDRQSLLSHRQTIAEWLPNRLGIEPKPNSFLNRTTHGMDWLGTRVFASHVTLNRRSRVRFAQRLSEYERQHAAGHLSEAELQSRATALVAFVTTASVKSWKFREAVLQECR